MHLINTYYWRKKNIGVPNRCLNLFCISFKFFDENQNQATIYRDAVISNIRFVGTDNLIHIWATICRFPFPTKF